MRTVTAMDMRRRLGEILDAASAGERILIERDHRPLAYLVSVEEGARLDGVSDDVRRRRLAAIDRLEVFAAEMSRKYPMKPGDPDAAALVRLDRDRDEPKGEPADE
jgi:prevent-host-death family protein